MHEIFYRDTIIEFTAWKYGEGKSIAIFKNFHELPSHLHDELEEKSSEIALREKMGRCKN